MAVATVAFCIGGLLIAASGIFVLLMLSDLRALWILRRRRPAPAGAVGPVAFEATTEYGPAGPQTAPLSGEDCTWFRLTVLRTPSRATADSDHDVLLEIESPTWPVIADRGHHVPVDPRLVAPGALHDPIQTEPRITITTTVEQVPPPPIVPASILNDMRKNDRLRLIEVRVPRAVPVFATGRVTARGLRPSRLGLTILTPGTRAGTLATHQNSIRTGRTIAAALFLLGLLLATPSAVWLSPLL
ncbi:hypothetical protein SAMN04489716_1500 [Actinoplanes derwentensis]|uniref:Uncharacterized protein n=2 Tax=Actinoplanes derwentensis TaxID=113562 RepID=A0A1H1UNW7_9ACTN|nr:hypothetical protein Ade03nite_70470 [Actinoplanes derwentensis]SDS74232.1 hypothetical protein SAMN04489716_1500 [Actinoplanes derwentensis]